VLWLAPRLALNIPSVQQKVTSWAEVNLSKLLDSHVGIGKVEVRWISRITVRDIHISDNKGDTLFKASDIITGFKIFPAFRKKYVLTTVRIMGFECNLTQDNGRLNIQNVIDALSEKSLSDTTVRSDTAVLSKSIAETAKKSDIELQINSLMLHRGSIRYDVAGNGNVNHEMRFNPHHIHINNINGRASVRFFSSDSVNIRINSLRFDEASGLNVKKLTLAVIGKPDSLNVENLTLSLPHSTLSIPKATFVSAPKEADSTTTDDYKDSSTTNRLRNNPLNVIIAKSEIAPRDFATFLPVLTDFKDVINLSADISGSINSLDIDNMNITYGARTSLSGFLTFKGLAGEKQDMFLNGRVRESTLTTEGLQRICESIGKFSLPQSVIKAREISFTGEVSGYLRDMQAVGTLASPVGTIKINLNSGYNAAKDTMLFINSIASSSDLQLNAVLPEGNKFGTVGFDADIAIIQTAEQKLSGSLNAKVSEFDYNGYKYSNINVSGKYRNNRYEGLLFINDTNGRLELEGSYDNERQTPMFDVIAKATGIRPDKLNLLSKYTSPVLSFNLNATFSGNNADSFDGYIKVDDFSFGTSSNRFSINELNLISTTDTDSKRRALTIASDVVNGEISGYFSFASLFADLRSSVGLYIPALAPYPTETIMVAEDDVDFTFRLTVGNIEDITKTLKLPFAVKNQAVIEGHYNKGTNGLFAEAVIPDLQLFNSSLHDGHILIENTDSAIYMQLDATHQNKNALNNYISLRSTARNDNLESHLRWSNDKSERYEAELTALAVFVNDIDGGKSKLRTELTIPQSQIILKDSLWNIDPTAVTIADGKVNVDHFYLRSNGQFLHANGIVSDNPRDAFLLELKDIEMSYIFEMLNIPALQFGGKATGAVNGRDLLGSMMLDGRLEIEQFAFNRAVQGKLNISGEWDADRKGILLLGTIYKNDSTFTDVNGYVFPVGHEQGLSLYFDANEINVAFVQRYLQAFASDVSGKGYGNVHVYGNFSDIFVEGRPYIKDAKMKINILNTAYTFSDTLFLDKERISTKNTTVYDRDGNKATLNFSLAHNNFRNLSYELDVNAEKTLVYDISATVNPRIYGHVYASGTATVKGTEEEVAVNGNVRSEAGTTAGFNFMQNSTVADYDFVTFINSSKQDTSNLQIPFNTTPESKSKSVIASTASPEMDYQLDFLVNITPDAKVELVVDPIQNDKIKGEGSGNLQIQFGNKSDVQMFGNYQITNGIYNFSLQQMLSRRFNIRDGSSVSFRGDPMTANININAYYNLAANIQDLDESLLLETTNPTIPVNCILKLDGQLRNPTISFDIELPSSNSELERQVKSFIDTEDMLTRQIIYLLVLSKFYTPDYSRNTYTGDQFSAMASSALSSQLSNILSSLTDKVQVGANIRSRQDGIKDTEVEMLLSSQLLNNRLLFNGNFGYKDNYIQSNAFVGEFDLEYKLTRSGEISLKAYNHANDLYRYNTKSLTRQGVGIMFRKDFSTLSEIFRRRKLNPQPGHQQDK
jgi:hypothetical protein